MTTKGKKHTIKVHFDMIEGKPSIEHIRTPFVRNGTLIDIEWPGSSRLLLSPESEDSYNPAYELVESFSAFNPHARFSVNEIIYPATAPTWKKWNPDMPTSAHWYSIETLRSPIAAYIAEGRNGGGHEKLS